MVQIRLSTILLVAGSLWLSGCATPGKVPTIDAAISPLTSDVSKLGGAQPGDLVDLPAGNIFGERAVVVGNGYTAASGRHCRRMRSEGGSVLSRIVCQREAGEWYSPRSLDANTGSAKQTFSQAVSTEVATSEAVATLDTSSIEDGSVVVVDLTQEDLQTNNAKVRTEAASIETSAHTLNQGETLWSFSRRITGNALNWHTIAELNDIDDSRRLVAGDALLVPKTLVRGEL